MTHLGGFALLPQVVFGGGKPKARGKANTPLPIALVGFQGYLEIG